MTGRDRPPTAVWDDPESADSVDPYAEARRLLAGPGAPRRRNWLGSRRRQAFAGVVVLGAIGFLVFQGLTNATSYFLTTKQAVARQASLGTRVFRLEGTVERDVRYVDGTSRFNVASQGVAVAVVNTGTATALFKPGVPVVLVGHWQGTYFASNQIMVKHTAQYTEAHPGRVATLPAPTTKASP